ncbi:MAG: M23 family metallopeptidase [Chloroflexota bacterium]
MKKYKGGVHVVGGPRNNYGAAAPYCVLVTSLDEAGAFDELDDRCVKVFRTEKLRDLGYDENAPGDIDRLKPEEMKKVAAFWWPLLRENYAPVNAKFKNVYFQPINEVDTLNSMLFQAALVPLAEADGFKLALGGLSGNSPSVPEWLSVWLPFFREMSGRGHIYARHAYSGVDPVGENGTTYLTDSDGVPTDDNSRRPFVEAEIFLKEGIDLPIAITELGWLAGWNKLPPAWWEDFERYNLLMLQYSNIVGSCLWNAGKWLNAPNQLSGEALKILGAKWSAGTPVWFDSSKPVAEPPAPSTDPDKPKAEDFETKEEFFMALVEWHRVINYNGLAALERAITGDSFVPFSGEIETEWDGVQFVIQGAQSIQGEYQDHKRVYEVEKDKWDRIKSTTFPFKANGEPVEDKPLTAEELLSDFTMGQPVNAPWVITSRFNAIRKYGIEGVLDLHEGGDLDVTNTAGNSRASVLATNPGTIIDVRDHGRNGYGKHVILETFHRGVRILLTLAHLDAIYVGKGQRVVVGDHLGEIGGTGNSTAEHLHITMQVIGYGLRGYVRDWVVDPIPYLPRPIAGGGSLPAPKKYDLLTYFLGAPGRQYMVKHYKGPFAGSQERFRIIHQPELKRFWILKNNQWELYFYDDRWIYQFMDTSPGRDQFYHVFYPGSSEKVKRCPRYMHIGQTWQDDRPHMVQYRHKRDCRPVLPLPDGTDFSGSATNWAGLKKAGSWVSPERITYPDTITVTMGVEDHLLINGTGPGGWVMEDKLSAITPENVTHQRPYEPEIISCFDY